jgi:hypothetical protein
MAAHNQMELHETSLLLGVRRKRSSLLTEHQRASLGTSKECADFH